MGLGQQRTDKGVVYDGGIGNLLRFWLWCGAWKILEIAITPKASTTLCFLISDGITRSFQLGHSD